MAPAAAFAEVLDACVDLNQFRGPAAAGRCQPSIATRSLFWFEGSASVAPRPSAAPSAFSRGEVPHAAAPLRLVHSDRRPKRTLSPRQHEALMQLAALGATLTADFTFEELRSAFRSLARAYHPDHHPGRATRATVPVSQVFVTLRSAYDTLKSAA